MGKRAMKRILILIGIILFLCSTASALQGGGGESTKKGSSKKKAVTKKNSGTTSAKTTPPGPPASPVPTPATTKAQAVDRERQYEALRIAERTRVEQGIAGEWSDGTSRLTIIKDGDKFSAVYPSGKGAQVMHGELLADNQLRLTNNSVGKIVNPFEYYVGDFDKEAWIELGGDGSFLTVRFSQAKGGRSLVMKRIAGNPASRVPEANTVIWASVSAGSSYACAVTTTGAPYCWGDGHGDITSDEVFGSPGLVPIIGDMSVAMVSAGNGSTCWVTTSGAAYCSGGNDFGQLGNGKGFTDRVSGNRDSAVPVAVVGELRFSVVSAGNGHACGLTTSGAAYCWGTGGWGNLGTGATKDALTPIPVASALKFASISSGGHYTCGVTTNGALYCWGTNAYGELGGATTGRSSLIPVAVPVPTDADGFKAFFREFSSAVREHDRATLELMMSPTIEFPVEIGSPSMAFDYLGYNNGEGWKQLEESVTTGTKPYKDSSPQPVTRVTNDNWVLFARGSDGKWRWLRFGIPSLF